MTQQFFADNNIRKWLYQIIRQFSGFTVQYGLDSNGNQLYSTVPVIWGDATFSAATIARLNTENVMPSFPLMSLYIYNLKFDRPRTQTPTFQDTLSVRTREFDQNTQSYTPNQANAYTVKRFMPVPYSMDIKLDIVTSNTQQKLQILEQLLPLYNPALEIQKTDNYLDWESLSYIELTDVSWSSRTIPTGQGNDSSYDVCTLQFQIPIWMSLPAQVSKMGVIFKVITDITGMEDMSDLVLNTRQVVTFNNYGIYVQDGKIQILAQGPVKQSDIPEAFWNSVTTASEEANLEFLSPEPFLYGSPLDWTGILGVYGKMRPGVSQIGLSYDNSVNEILGTITVNPLDSTILFYNANIATLPSNTLPMINGVVNPQQIAPPNISVGQNYLLTANIGSAWPYNTTDSNASANVNDIISYDGNNWITTFSASNNIGNVQFVFDNSTNLQYKWNGNAWVQGWQGPYDAASWRLIL